MVAAARANSFVIPSGSTVSQTVDISAYGENVGFVAFIIPAAFTGSSVSFKVSIDDTTYVPLNDSSNSLISINVSVSTAYSFKQDVRSCMDPWRFFQMVSASSEGASRTIPFIVE